MKPTMTCHHCVQKSKRAAIPLRRRGAATVELAICLPVLALLVLGSIEAASFIFLKQTLQVAAYEGIRTAIRSGAQDAEAVNSAQAILDSRAVRDAQVEFPSGSLSSLARGQQVTIEVSAPTRTNSPLAGQWVANRTLTARLVMLKE
ncbi:MAG: TadE/TadG family type IV pilus assembly protein [Planctomycetaceae bacterium]